MRIFLIVVAVTITSGFSLSALSVKAKPAPSKGVAMMDAGIRPIDMSSGINTPPKPMTQHPVDGFVPRQPK